MNITHLKSFLAVADTASFTKAAEGLFTTQPTLSRHISMLESELGVKLLDRDRHHHVSLTPAGHYLFDKGKLWIAEMISIERGLSNYGSVSDPRLDIICSPMYSQILRNIFSAFRKENPDVICNIRQVETGKEFHAVQDNDADIGVLFATTELIDNDSFNFQRLSVEKMCLVCGIDDPIAKKEPLRLDDFKEKTLVISKFPMNAWLSDLHQSIAPYFKQIIFVDNIEMVILNISANQGIAIWPEIIIKNTQAYSKILDVPEFDYYTELVAVWKKQNDNIYAKRFLEMCKTGL